MTVIEFLLARIAEDERKWGNPALAPVAGVGLSDLVRKMRAECEAKRRIVEDYRHLVEMGPGVLTAHAEWACRTLAAVYADHPDYNQDW